MLKSSARIPIHDVDPVEGLAGILRLDPSSAQLKLWHAQMQRDMGVLSSRELAVMERLAGQVAGRSRTIFNPYSGEIRQAFLPDWVGAHREEDAPIVGWSAPDSGIVRARGPSFWDGKATQESMLVYCEDNFAESILFARFLDRVFALAPNAFVEIQPQLFDLFECAGIVPEGRLYKVGDELPVYTKHCSLPSIGWRLNATEEDIARRPHVFKRDDLPLFPHFDEERSVGLCCRGIQARPLSHDAPIGMMEAIKESMPRNRYFCLCQGFYQSLADMAAVIAGFDLVITVESVVAHLAASLNIPVWLMLSSDADWRWGDSGDTTIWYPSVRIFRQPQPGDWDAVTRAVTVALTEETT